MSFWVTVRILGHFIHSGIISLRIVENGCWYCSHPHIRLHSALQTDESRTGNPKLNFSYKVLGGICIENLKTPFISVLSEKCWNGGSLRETSASFSIAMA